jgi:hydroxyacylglutathione hydrolase
MAQDNYGWLLLVAGPRPHDPPRAIVVDPTHGPKVLTALKGHGAILEAIWATHHHHDHVGGIAHIVAQVPGPVAVVAGALDVAADRIPHATVGLEDGQTWAWGALKMRALHVPGHTLGATAFHVPEAAAVFVGDTLFAGGCGRLFEGDPAMMWRSLKKLRALPPDTQIYCGHEYTEKNVRFALSVEPEHAPAREALGRAQRLRAQGQATVPTQLADEMLYNPFLRADDPRLLRRLEQTDPIAAFAALRSARNDFLG